MLSKKAFTNSRHAEVALLSICSIFKKQGVDYRLGVSPTGAASMLENVACQGRELSGSHPTYKGCKAFTLIELLVVVLIIGILAAVAVPQYQKAVLKTRYNMLKNVVESVVMAQEIYYLGQGTYATRFDQLDIQMPGDKLNTSTATHYYYPWGECALFNVGGEVRCNNRSIQMGYGHFFFYSDTPNKRVCYVYNDETEGLQSKLCSQDTNNSKFSHPSGELRYTYQ